MHASLPRPPSNEQQECTAAAPEVPTIKFNEKNEIAKAGDGAHRAVEAIVLVFIVGV